jgi:hypothetical protein
MCRIDAPRIAAKMIEVQALRHRADEERVCEAMRLDEPQVDLNWP